MKKISPLKWNVVGGIPTAYPKRLKPSQSRKKGSRLRTRRRNARIPKSLLKKADEAFSLKIRARDKHCQFPSCMSRKMLQCSHYIGRANKSTRFDPDNCITLCWYHHYKSKSLGYEYQKQTLEKEGWDGQYTIFMRDWLGEGGFRELQNRAKTKKKITKEYLNNLILSLKSTTT